MRNHISCLNSQDIWLSNKVQMFWEGHKILKNNSNFFDTSLWRLTNWEILSKLCGILRICQLYNIKDIHLLCAFLRKNHGYAPGNTLFTMVCCCYSARPSCCLHMHNVSKKFMKLHLSFISPRFDNFYQIKIHVLFEIEKYLRKYLVKKPIFKIQILLQQDWKGF